MSEPRGERLNRFLARRGIASRRSADELIAAGRVLVNGEPGVVGTVVDPASDAVSVDGRSVGDRPDTVTVALNKPPGVVSTRRDPQRRRTVMDLVDPIPGLVPVGRLDTDSRGLLLLTSDGELAHRLAHPRYGVPKRYEVTLRARASDAQLALLRRGVSLEDGFARPVEVSRASNPTALTVVMGEGRKREVRRLCAAAGLDVVDLRRIAIGPLELGSLGEGRARRLSAGEEDELRAAVGLGGGDPERSSYDASRVVTVDGPAGSGKSTLGSRLAEALELPFVDTGVFYRAVAAAAEMNGVPTDDERRSAALVERIVVHLSTTSGDATATFDGAPIQAEHLRDPALAPALSRVSAMPAVRRALLQPQRALAMHGAVAAGRDCGTVVFPDARVKLYLQAGEHVREQRRAHQLSSRGDGVDEATLSAEVAARDRADSTRAAAPLRPAEDAHIIDTEVNGIEDMVRIALEVCADAGLVAR